MEKTMFKNSEFIPNLFFSDFQSDRWRHTKSPWSVVTHYGKIWEQISIFWAQDPKVCIKNHDRKLGINSRMTFWCSLNAAQEQGFWSRESVSLSMVFSRTFRSVRAFRTDVLERRNSIPGNPNTPLEWVGGLHAAQTELIHCWSGNQALQ